MSAPEQQRLQEGCARCGHGMGKMHELKTWPVYFRDILSGHKQFELRADDRGFETGDTLHLREYDPETEQYTGRALFKRVAFVLSKAPGLEPGYVIMGMQPVMSTPEQRESDDILNLTGETLESVKLLVRQAYLMTDSYSEASFICAAAAQIIREITA